MKVSKKKLQKIIQEELKRLLVKEDNHTPRDRGELGGPMAQDAARRGRPGVFPGAGGEGSGRDKGKIYSVMAWRSDPTGRIGSHAYITLYRQGDKPSWWEGNQDYMTLSGFSERYREGYESTPWFEQFKDMYEEMSPDLMMRILDQSNATGFGRLVGGVNWPNDYRKVADGEIALGPMPVDLTTAERNEADDIQVQLFNSHNNYRNNWDYFVFPDMSGQGDDANSNSYAFSIVRDALGFEPTPPGNFPGSNIHVI